MGVLSSIKCSLASGCSTAGGDGESSWVPIRELRNKSCRLGRIPITSITSSTSIGSAPT